MPEAKTFAAASCAFSGRCRMAPLAALVVSSMALAYIFFAASPASLIFFSLASQIIYLSSELARLMYSTRSQANWTKACLLDRQLKFQQANQIIHVTPPNYQILPPVFHYYLAPTESTKTRVIELSVTIYWTMEI